MKKILSLLFILSLIFVFNITSFKADEFVETFDDTGSVSWKPTAVTSKEVNGLKYTNYRGNTFLNGRLEGNQSINVLEMKTDGVNSKLVSWSKLSGNKHYTLAPLTTIAKDYEETHPGWVVVGGINGDQFVVNNGNDLSRALHPFRYQPYYPYKFDGEARFPFSALGSFMSQYVGIRNDGSTDGFIDPEAPAGIRLEIIDENGNIKYTHPVNNINKTPEAGETTVWSSYLHQDDNQLYVEFDVTTENKLYMVSNPELAYIYDHESYPTNSTGFNGFFGRGMVDQVVDTYHFGGTKDNPKTYPYLNGFGIETTDEELKAKLVLGTRIRVEYYWNNEELNSVECFGNFHSTQREDGVDIAGLGGYDGTHYSRSVFGQKDDGTYVLVTTDCTVGGAKEFTGTNQEETNAFLKSINVVDAYQQDGGGSVTQFMRNEAGEFELTQDSIDNQAQRGILAGLFFVVRDTGLKVDLESSDYHSVTFKKNSKIDYSGANITIKESGKEVHPDNNLKVTGLEPDKTYNFTITVKFSDGSSATTSQSYTTPSFELPEDVITKSFVGKNSVIFKTTDKNVLEGKITINDKDYPFVSGEVKIEGLEKDTEYTYTYTLSYFDKESTLTIPYTSNGEDSFKTKFADPPQISMEVISDDKQGNVTVNVHVIDTDNVISKLYVCLNDTMYDLINFAKPSTGDYPYTYEGFEEIIGYGLSACAEYYEQDGEDSKLVKVKTDEIIYSYEASTDPSDPGKDDPAKTGCNKAGIVTINLLVSSAIALLFILKKKH